MYFPVNLFTAIPCADNKEPVDISHVFEKEIWSFSCKHRYGFIPADVFKINTDTKPTSGNQQHSKAPVNNKNRAWKTYESGMTEKN
jgi:hypothetical protein